LVHNFKTPPKHGSTIVPLGIQPELLLMFHTITVNASLSWVMVSQAVITDLLNIMSFEEAKDDV
jgi:hypothetical protein